MAYTPISGAVPQFQRNAGGASASGYYLKGYQAGTTTPLSMGTDSTPSATLAKCRLNSRGEPISNDADETTVFIPYFNAAYKLVLYTNSTDADNNTVASAVWVVDNIQGIFDASQVNFRSGATVADFLQNSTVADYTELRALTVSELADGDVVTVTDSGIAGSGVLRNVASHGLSDNGVTRIVINSNWYWLRTFDGEINVRWAGAVGDGIANDTAAIQAALTALNASGGGKLSFPFGTYLVSGLVTYSKVFIDLGGSTLKQRDGTNNTPIIQGTGVSNVAVMNGKFDGNKTNVTGNLAGGIQFVGSNNIFVKNVEFDGIRRICINIDSSTQATVQNVNAANIGVAGAALGTLLAVVNNSANVKLSDASISLSDGVGVQFFNARQVSVENYKAQTIGTDNGLVVEECTNVSIKNITASGCANQGIEVNSSTNVSIENIACFSNGVYGLMISTFTGGTEQPCVGVSLRNAYCYSNGSQDIRLIGVRYLAATGLNVTGTLNITNSAGGVATRNIEIIESTIGTLLLTSGSYIRVADCNITTLTNVGANYTINDSSRRPITGFSGSIANGGSTTIRVPTDAVGAFNGLLVVGSYFVSSATTQNTAAIYNLSQYGSTQVTTLSAVNGPTAGRQVSVTVSANTITLTNSTGVDCYVSAALFAVSI